MEGGGSYSFIPDSGFVGTIFVHQLANQLVTSAVDARLRLEFTGEGSFSEVLGGHFYTKEPNTNAISLNVGDIKFG